MKKLLIAAFMLFGFAGIASAQTAAKAAPAKKSEMKVVKKETSAPAAKVVKMDKAAPAATPTKADGTPDKRFKANKAAPAAAPAGPVKKDGTPDKRFKANKKG